jgi:ferredoxin-type protein NapH
VRLPRVYLIQPARRTVQLLVLLFLMFTAFFSMYGVLKHHGLLIRMDVRFFQAIYYTMDAVAGVFYQSYDEVYSASNVLKGSTWVYSIGSLTLADPLAALSHAAATRTISLAIAAAAAAPLVFTLFFGRAFCGWICPMNTLLEALDWVRGRVSFLDVSFSRKTKYYLLGGALLLAMMGAPLIPLVYPPLIIGREIYNYVFYLGFGSGALFLLGIAVFELFVSRRAWCRYFCPGGALLSLLGSRAPLGLRRDEEACSHKTCMECREACMLGLDPVSGRDMRECSRCGQCILHCPEMALGYSLSMRWVGNDKKN